MLILFNSLEAVAKVKDVEMFNKWHQETYLNEQIDDSNFPEYLVGNMAEYFLKTAFPVSIALTAYFAIGNPGYLEQWSMYGWSSPQEDSYTTFSNGIFTQYSIT